MNTSEFSKVMSDIKIFCHVMVLILTISVPVITLAQKKKVSKKPKSEPIFEINSRQREYNEKLSKELVVVTISPKGEWFMGDESVAKENLTELFEKRMSYKLPFDEIIFVKASANTPFSQVIETLKLGRKANVETFGLKIDDESKTDIASTASMIKVPAEETEPTTEKVKAHPLALVVSLETDGKIKLNSKPETVESLTKKLKQAFLIRKQKRIYRIGSRNVDKTVFVYAPREVKFGDVVNLIELVKKTGADLIGLDIDDYFLKTVF